MIIYVLEIILSILGIVMLVIGYRKNSRNILLAGAIILACGCALQEFVKGFLKGWQYP